MSLVELMVAMTIFAMLALSITAAVIQSQRISQNNIIVNTGYTAAQGYLEQIKSLPYSAIEAALDDPDEVPLPTKSISVLAGSDTEVEDPIFLDGPDRTLSGQSDGSNKRDIMIDLKENDDGSVREIVMDAWFDIDISPLENRSHSHAITVNFEVRLRGGSTGTVSGMLRGLRADINQDS